MSKYGFVIAATNSGCGKTTFSLGLMRCLSQRGLKVQPFKCGPDYIDTQFHAVATGNASINVDTFMSSEAHVKDIFCKYDSCADVSVVEGVMGMFDGYSRDKGSSGAISKLLHLPVVLLVNAASTAYSVAATVFGYKNFRKDIRIAGVVFNRVASESHYSFLKDACNDAGVECFGYIRKRDDLETPSRHLGLTLGTVDSMNRFIENAKDAVMANVDIDRLLEAARKQDSHYVKPVLPNRPLFKVAVANDEAFNFIYPENLEALRNHKRLNCEISFFSPIHDACVPNADLVYLPGGYPELFAPELEANESMRKSVREYVERGGRLLGECGGMIYLTEMLDGHSMCGVLPLKCTMESARLTLGYRRVDIGGNEYFGHEFHYSHITEPNMLQSAGCQFNVKGVQVGTPVYRIKNAIATYTHFYWADNDLLKLWDL